MGERIVEHLQHKRYEEESGASVAAAQEARVEPKQSLAILIRNHWNVSS